MINTGIMAGIGEVVKDFKSQQQDTSNPGHTHSNNTTVGSGLEGIAGTIRGDVPRQDQGFMGNNPNISGIEFSDVTREGRAVPVNNLDSVGIAPSINPPMATPITSVDDTGMNELLSQ